MANDPYSGPPCGGLDPDAAALLVERVRSITATGRPLATGLRATADEMPHGKVAWALRSVAGAVERGETLDEALGEGRTRLPRHLRGIILIGSRSGRMTEVLGRFLEYVNIGDDLRGKLWLALAYPALSLLVSFGVFVFLCVSVVGSFSAVLKDFGVTLTGPTILLLGLASLFGATGWWRVVEAGVGLVVVAVFLRLLTSTAQRRAIVGKIPVLGGVSRNASLAEFCHLLGLLLESELPLNEAVSLTGEGVNDATISRACQSMRADLDDGLTLWQAITRRPVFPVGLGRVLHWAEGYRGLPGSLHTAGEMFEARARSQAYLAGTILGVLVILSILLTIGLVIFGLIVPMWSILSRLAG